MQRFVHYDQATLFRSLWVRAKCERYCRSACERERKCECGRECVLASSRRREIHLEMSLGCDVPQLYLSPPSTSLSLSTPLPLSRYPSLHRRIRPRRVAKGIAHRRTCNIVSNRCKAVRWVRRNRALRAVCKYGDVVKGTTRSVACRDCVAQCHAKANKKTTTTARDWVREDFSAHH